MGKMMTPSTIAEDLWERLRPATSESIARAKAWRDKERREIEAATGVVVLESGQVILPKDEWLALADRVRWGRS